MHLPGPAVNPNTDRSNITSAPLVEEPAHDPVRVMDADCDVHWGQVHAIYTELRRNAPPVGLVPARHRCLNPLQAAPARPLTGSSGVS
jgi:hypothetical protein